MERDKDWTDDLADEIEKIAQDPEVTVEDKAARRAIEGAPRNMMIGSVQTPETAPLNRGPRAIDPMRRWTR